MRRPPIVCLAPLLLGLSIGLPRSAAAFCQTQTCEFSGTQRCTWDASAGCWTGGAVARWGSRCITYAVQEEGSSDDGISAAQLAAVLEDGFRIWSDVECDTRGRTPELHASYRGLTRCDAVEFNCSERDANDNIVMFRDGRNDLTATTIALSTIIANTSTGEILDVDVEINSQDFDFYLEEGDARPESHDLRLVLNHELGHFLGLSHTLEPGALMRAAYDGFDRFPAEDDIAGMCQTQGASSSDPVCEAQSSAGACVGIDANCAAPLEPIEESGCALSGGPAGRGRERGRGALLVIATGLLLLGRGSPRACALVRRPALRSLSAAP